ncbi:hypothetical protein OX283_008110 [Flavobacterium sp. SUN052]|uniref:tetratricopeptide repeat protein n=1 Tax=Flavobacterium sp. SUN052 TaxID=3002441 RepID=UPI00237E2035|nr:hypothetical protein [Flavobacterium sp. SUN052]MEC4004616.1 hypothetical protein [Flavobacterium sp. SUN052]
MKTKLLFLLVVLISHVAKSQEINCAEKENQLSKFVVDQDYSKAFDVWNEAKTSCPKYSEKLYSLGIEVLQYTIETATPKLKEEKVRELLKVLDLYDKNFPSNKNGNFEKRALALYQNHAGTEDEIYNFLDQAFEKQKEEFSNPQALDIYFRNYFDKYKSGKSTITTNQLFDKYIALVSLTESNTAKHPENAGDYVTVNQNLNSLMNDLLSCDNLIPYAKNGFELNKSNISWLFTTSKILSVNCKTAPIFGIIASQLYSLKPSSKSAYYLATFNLNTGNLDKAVEYYKESISLATDKLEKATTAYTAASVLVNQDASKCQEMILVAIENKPNNGKYFIFLANLYANSVVDCGSSSNEKKAIYKLASNTVLKAALAEPRLKPTAEVMSKEYLKNVTFEKNEKVKSVKIGCWINQTIQF